MAVKTEAELLNQMPIGVDKQSSVQDIHDIINTLFARTSSTSTGLVEDWSGEIRQPVNSPSVAFRHTILRKSAYVRNLNELSIGLAGGSSFTVTIYINDVAVSGLTSVGATVAGGVYTVTGTVVIPLNAKVTMAFSGITTPSEQVVTWTVKTTRV